MAVTRVNLYTEQAVDIILIILKRSCHNKELHHLYKEPDITDIKICRLKSAGHIQRMSDGEMVMKIAEYKPDGRRRVGRPKLGWMEF